MDMPENRLLFLRPREYNPLQYWHVRTKYKNIYFLDTITRLLIFLSLSVRTFFFTNQHFLVIHPVVGMLSVCVHYLKAYDGIMK